MSDLLHAEVLAEFQAFAGGFEDSRPTSTGKRRLSPGAAALDHGGWSMARRVSQAQKARDRAKLVSDVDVARRAEAAKRAPPVPCAAGCGALVYRTPHKRGPAPKWCSERCYARWYARGRAKTCGAPAVVSCESCGQSVPRPTHQRGPAKRFCSARCQARSATARRRLST